MLYLLESNNCNFLQRAAWNHSCGDSDIQAVAHDDVGSCLIRPRVTLLHHGMATSRTGTMCKFDSEDSAGGWAAPIQPDMKPSTPEVFVFNLYCRGRLIAVCSVVYPQAGVCNSLGGLQGQWIP